LRIGFATPMYDPDFDWDELDDLIGASGGSCTTAVAATRDGADRSDSCERGGSQAGLDVETSSEARPDSWSLHVTGGGSAWAAHSGQANAVNFDVFRVSPGMPVRLYSGSWDEASLCCWELSPDAFQQRGPEAGGSNAARPKPRLLGQMPVGGFLNGFALCSKSAFIVGASAGLMPTPGESLQVYELGATPLGHKGDVLASEGVPPPTEVPGSQQANWLATAQSPPGASSKSVMSLPVPRPGAPQKIFLHTRGCRALCTWPRAVDARSVPELVASISKILCWDCARWPQMLVPCSSLPFGARLTHMI